MFTERRRRVSFAPYAAMKKILAAAAALLMILVPVSEVFAFPDVTEDMWCYEVIERAAEEGIIHGYKDGLFRPDRTVNFREFLIMCGNLGYKEDLYPERAAEMIPRGYMALILYEMLLRAGVAEYGGTQDGPVYSDITAGDEYSIAVAACSRTGLLQGYKDGTFRPGAFLKRSEAAAVLVRYIDYLGIDPVAADMDHKAVIEQVSSETGLAPAGNGLTFTYVLPELPSDTHFAVDLHIYRQNSQGGDDTVFYMNSDEGWLSDKPAHDMSPGVKTINVPGVYDLSGLAVILRFEIYELLEGDRVGELTSYTYTQWYDGVTTLLVISDHEHNGNYIRETSTQTADFGQFLWK